jgi:uncharacterized membrane protein YkoI
VTNQDQKNRGMKMLKKTIMAIFILVAISTIIIGVYAVSVNKDSSGNMVPNQLISLGSPLINTPTGNNNIKTNHISLKVPEKETTTKINIVNHISKSSIISTLEAQKIASKYIEQTGATPGSPKLVTQDGKKVYIVPVVEKTKNVGEIDLDAHNGSNLGGAGGVKL